MTTPVGAHSTYNEPIATGGNREDLSDILFDVSPTETPFITAAKKNRSTATNHEFLTDRLEDATGDNAQIEGQDADPQQAASRTRLGNYTQILSKHGTVTGTQERVLKGGGIKSEMAYQVARRLKAIKRDCETSMVGVNNPKEAGDEATAREMGSFSTYLSGTSFLGGNASTPPAGNGVDVPVDGDPRPFTEEILQDALAQLWEQSGGNENIMMLTGSVLRGVLSTFTASSTRYVTTDDKKLVASIDVYDGDFHTVTVAPDRFTLPGNVFLIDQEYVSIADLRPVFTKDLAITGDTIRKEIIWETTLEVCNPLAHMNIAALT